MTRIRVRATAVSWSFLPILGIFLSTVGGCGGSPTPDENPDISAQRTQARIAAYGKSGSPATTKGGSGGAMGGGAQAAARRGGR